MTMQNNIDIIRRIFRRNMNEPELQTFAGKIDNQGPVDVPIAIAAHHDQRRTDRFQVQRDRRFANITQMPNLIRIPRKIDNLLRQLVMSVGNNQHAHCFVKCAP